MNERLCPITGELLPVTDPGRIVSQTACNRLRVATSDLTGLMGVIDALIAGEGHTHAHGSGGVAGPRAPLSLAVLDRVDDWRDAIDVWAGELLGFVRPGMGRRPGDWRAAQAIFTQFSDRCGYWTQQWQGQTQLTGAMCIDEVTFAIQQLEAIASPRETVTVELSKDEAIARLEGVSLTVREACQAAGLIVGRQLPPDTVYKWEARGKIVSTGNPRRFPVVELIALMEG